MKNLAENERAKTNLPLEGDSSRQATSLFRGIDYQIWQTVLAWMDLKETEMLVVEGAEDFDTIDEASAISHQIKDLSSPISLRSECVKDALRNFWISKHKNPGRNIKFRLITTAPLSIESGKPFNVARPGLELWNEAGDRDLVEHSRGLQQFLITDQSVSEALAEAFTPGIPSLVDHLSRLSPQEFHTEFIAPIRWLPHQPDVSAVREEVRLRLHSFGERFRLLPRDSDLALAPLFEHVAHVAIKEHRVLTPDDLRVQFDNSTRVQIPIAKFNQLQAEGADGPQLTRAQTLEFQSNIVDRVCDIQAETLKTQETIQQTGQGIIQTISPELQQIHAVLKVLSDKTSEPAVAERIYHDRVEQARKLLESGKPKTARRMLEELRSEIANLNPSKSLLFRIATNLGSCAIQMDDQTTVIREIDLAFALDPENPKAITNLSTNAVLRKQPQQALELAERARRLSPQDSIATSNYIQALFGLGRETELDTLLKTEPWIEKDANCCFAIGKMFFEKGRFDDAERFFRFGLAVDPTEPHLLIDLAHTLVRPIQNSLLGQPVLDWKFPQDAKLKLREAEEFLSAAIATQEDFEDRRLFAFAHVLRSDVRRLLGNEAGAIADCEIAVHENPSDQSVLPLKGLAHLHAGQFDDAIKAFEKISNEDEKRAILPAFAAAYLATNKAAKALNLLTPHWQTLPHTPLHTKIADPLLAAHSQLGNIAEADKLIETLKQVWPTDPEAMSAIASELARRNRIKEATEVYTEALVYATGSVKDFISLELAEIYYARGEFSKAADLYESTADLTTDNHLSRKYLVCLYNSGPRKEALRLARSLRGAGEPLPVISQIEANILSEIGDVKGAQEIMERLIARAPSVYAYRIAASEFAMRRGHLSEAKVLLEGVKFENVRNDASLLTRTAQLRAVLGMGDVLKYLFQARRAGFDSPRVHAIYVRLFVSREQIDPIELSKENVDGECTVALKVGNELRTYSILSETDLRPERGEISQNDAVRMGLLGRKKGESFVTNKDAFGNDINCTVLEIQSKYVGAFQATLKQFPTLFPTDRTLQGIEGPYEKFREGMFRQLDADQKAFQTFCGFYESRKITFEALAGVLRCSPVELWGMLTGGRYCTFANFSGSMQDTEMESSIASDSNALLLEFTAIFTLAQLGLLDRLKRRYKLYVTQPVLDVLAEAHAKAAIAKPSFTVGKVGETYVKEEITAERIGANKTFLEKILKFLAEHTTTVPVPSLLESNPETDEFREFIGPISTSSLSAARAEQLPLYSDDQMLRALGHNEYQIAGVSSQQIIRELHSKSVLSEAEFIDAISKLFFMNFSVVRVGADNVIWTLDKTGHHITDDVKRLLSLFHAPQCTFESAVEVLSEAMKRIWIGETLYHQKIDLLEAVLDSLGTNRPTKQVADHFCAAIARKLVFVPSAANAIACLVRLWKERKLGRGGIIVPFVRTSD